MRSIQVLKYPLPNIRRTEAEKVLLWDYVTPLERPSHKTHTKLKTFVPFWLSETSWLEELAPSDSYRLFKTQLLEFFHPKESRSDRSGGQDPTQAACVSENRGKHAGLNGPGPGHIPDLLLHILIPQLTRPLTKVRKIQAATSIGQCTIKISFYFFWGN